METVDNSRESFLTLKNRVESESKFLLVEEERNFNKLYYEDPLFHACITKIQVSDISKEALIYDLCKMIGNQQRLSEELMRNLRDANKK